MAKPWLSFVGAEWGLLLINKYNKLSDPLLPFKSYKQVIFNARADISGDNNWKEAELKVLAEKQLLLTK